MRARSPVPQSTCSCPASLLPLAPSLPPRRNELLVSRRFEKQRRASIRARRPFPARREERSTHRRTEGYSPRRARAPQNAEGGRTASAHPQSARSEAQEAGDSGSEEGRARRGSQILRIRTSHRESSRLPARPRREPQPRPVPRRSSTRSRRDSTFGSPTLSAPGR